jgi:hypothetical protein
MQSEGVAVLHSALQRATINTEKIDGVILELCAEELSSRHTTSEQLLAAMKNVLGKLCEHNVSLHPDDAKYCCYHLPSAPNTQLRICGQAFGAMCFAPSFAEADPRYSFGATSVFILFQPHVSFARKNLGEAQAWSEDGVARCVRKMYEDNGRGYPPFSADFNALRKTGAYYPDWYWAPGS